MIKVSNKCFITNLLLTWGVIFSIASLILTKLSFPAFISYGIKDLFIYAIFLLFIRSWPISKKFITTFFLLFLFLYFLILNYLILNENYSAPINNIRQIFSPILILFVLFSLKATEPFPYRKIKTLIIIIFSFGIIELVFSIWEYVNLKDFFNNKGIPVDSNGLSYMFYEPMIGYAKRMSSTFIDPISLGHFFATCVLILSYSLEDSEASRNEKYFYILISILGLILSFSKGAMLQLFLGIILLENRINFAFRSLLYFIPPLLLTLIPQNLLHGIYIHFEGVINSITSISLFGYGIGSVGNYTKMFSTDLSVYNKLQISDTFLGSIIGQIGLIGLILWLMIIFYIIHTFSSSRKNFITSSKILISILAISMMSENTLNVTSFYLPALLLAIINSTSRRIN
ncbi:hypothetical protein [Spongorhabdus nitratireducens]